MALKIKPMQVGDNWVIPPSVERMVAEWTEHKQDCVFCLEACKYRDWTLYCREGAEMIKNLSASPHVEFVPD